MSFINSILSKAVPSTAPAASETQPDFTLKPAYRLSQTPEAWTLVAHLPGVAKDGLEITAEDGVLSLRGRRQWQSPEGWTSLYRESYDSGYALALRYDQVDAGRIQAELKDGVLTVTLPKSEAAKSRKIAVN
jgi:HSP20 family protein